MSKSKLFFLLNELTFRKFLGKKVSKVWRFPGYNGFDGSENSHFFLKKLFKKGHGCYKDFRLDVIRGVSEKSFFTKNFLKNE